MKELRAGSVPIPLPSLGISNDEITVTVLPQELRYRIAYAVTDSAVFHAAFDFVGDGRVLTEFPYLRFVSRDPESDAYTILPEGITHEFSQHTINEEKGLYVQRGTLGRSELLDNYTLAVFKNLHAQPSQPLETITVEMHP